MTWVPAARTGARAVAVAVFGAYLVLLVWLVLFKLHAPYIDLDAPRTLKLTPFLATDLYGASAGREVLGNVLVFIPFGAGLALLAKRTSPWLLIALVVLSSAALESAQYALGVGVADVTDVITNGMGGALGVAVVRAVRRVGGP